jgi:hypothetical protein
MSKSCLEGFSTPAYKGAWHGLHDGTGVDTIWSPRLSPMRVLQGNPPWACLRIRRELLRLIPPWSFQQLGRPVGNLPYHPDGPPWLAGLGLHRWYTHLVYLQHQGLANQGKPSKLDAYLNPIHFFALFHKGLLNCMFLYCYSPCSN